MSHLTEKTIKQETVFNGRIIRVRCDTALLPDGSTAPREVVEHNGGVSIAALTEQDELLLVRQFRYPYMQVITEIPAGKLESGESPEACAVRELSEETGAAAASMTPLGKILPSPGYCGEIIYIFLATGLTFSRQHPDDDEFLDVVRMPFKEALQKVLDGEICDAKTAVAVLKIAQLHKKGESARG